MDILSTILKKVRERKEKEDKEYSEWKKERENGGNYPIFDDPSMSELEMSARMNASDNTKFEFRLEKEKREAERKEKEDKEYLEWKKERENGGNYPIFDDPSMSELEMSARMNASYNHKFESRLAREQREKEKRETDEQINEILNKLGYEKILKEDPRTLICDGAYLHCSKGVVVTQTHLGAIAQTTAAPALINQMPMEISMIKLKATHSSTYLMGIDQIATFLDIYPENFEPVQNLNCMEGGKCEIKNNAVMWTDYSQNLKIDGAGALLKNTRLICGKCPSANIKFIDNGQEEEIMGAQMEETLSSLGLTPTNRKILKSIIPAIVIAVCAIKLGAGIATIVVAKKISSGFVLITTSAVDGFLNGRDLYQTWTGEDILFNTSKGVLSMTGMKGELLDDTSNLVVIGIDTGFMLKDFKSMGENIGNIGDTYNKNLKINEIKQKNLIIDTEIASKQAEIKKLKHKFDLTRGKQPAPAFTDKDKEKVINLRENISNLESQKEIELALGNYKKDIKEFSITGAGQMTSQVKVDVNYIQIEEMDLNFEEFFYRSQLRYAKEPFTTKSPIATREN